MVCGDCGGIYWGVGLPEPTICCTSSSMFEFRRSIVDDHRPIVCTKSSSVACSLLRSCLLMSRSSCATESAESFLFSRSLLWPHRVAVSLWRQFSVISGDTALSWNWSADDPAPVGLETSSGASTATSPVSIPPWITYVAGEPPQIDSQSSK